MKTGRFRSGVLGLVGEALCFAVNLTFCFLLHIHNLRSRLGRDHSGHDKNIRPVGFFDPPRRNL
jgi:hypothetical protein